MSPCPPPSPHCCPTFILRSDIALILDPKTPLDQAIQHASTAAKTAAAAAAEAPAEQQISRLTPVAPPQQQQKQQQREAVRSSISLKRQTGHAAVTTTTTTAAAAGAAAATAGVGTLSAKEEGDGDDGFAGFVSAPQRHEGPEPPAHLVCPITNEVRMRY